MKLTTLFLIAVCLHVSAGGFAQKVSISGKDLSLEKVFSMIRKQTGYVFFYDYGIFEGARKVSLNVRDASVQDVLEESLKGQGLEFKILDKTITITKNEEPKVTTVETAPVNLLSDIHGRVVDENGLPLDGATIRQRKGKVLAVSDEKGNFVVRNLPDDVMLEFSYTGYESQYVKINTQGSLNIVLKVSQSKLDEVHVIAYGTTTQRFNVGSTAKVSADEIASQPVSNPLAALEGRVAGLVVTQNSGLPGTSFQVQIRGQNSLNPASSGLSPLDRPLFIIDGVPFATQNTNINQFKSLASPGGSIGDQYNNPYGGISPFNSINPSDIESIEVLRDADATSIYGSRGANGVILITTKRGKAGKTSLNINVNTGISQVPDNGIKLMNTQQYLQMRHEALNNDGVAPSLDNADYDLLAFDTTRYTDWKKYFLEKKAHAMDANLSLSGGNANTQYLFGAGYHRDTYIIPGNFADGRGAFNFNLHNRSTDQKLTMDLSAAYSYEKNNSSGSLNVLQDYNLPPDYPALLTSNGNVNWYYNGAPLYFNPLGYLKQTYNGQTYNLMSHFQVGYQLLHGLTIQSSFGYNTLEYDEYSGNPKAAQHPDLSPNATASFGTNNAKTWIVEPQAEYKLQMGRGKLDILTGLTFQQNTRSSNSVSGSNYSNDILIGSISAAGTKTVGADGYSLYKYNAGFGRINYIWEDKYILNVTGRRDGSSRFGPGRQFGNFGSVAAGWIFTEEPFIRDHQRGLNYGKLRASYGNTGSDNIGDYMFLPNWQATTLSYQGQTGYNPSNLYNPDFSWEVNKKLEIGLELSFFKDRLLGSVAWNQNRCGNQLVSYILPTQTGFSSVTSNFQGLIQNRDWEFTLSTVNVRTRAFSWNTSVTLTIPKNTLLAFPGLGSSPYANTYVIGQSTSVLNKVKYIGVNDTTGLFQFATAKGALTYSPNTNTVARGGDARPIGNMDPKFYGGMRNTFSYKGIQLDVFLQFVKQMGNTYVQQIYTIGSVGTQINQPVAFLSRWQKPGDQSQYQRFSQDGGSTTSNAIAYGRSDAAFGDASFIRVKSVSLSYSMPSGYVKKIKMEGCKVYVNAENLFTITSYKGDPETRSYYGIPVLRTVVAGLQFTF